MHGLVLSFALIGYQGHSRDAVLDVRVKCLAREAIHCCDRPTRFIGVGHTALVHGLVLSFALIGYQGHSRDAVFNVRVKCLAREAIHCCDRPTRFIGVGHTAHVHDLACLSVGRKGSNGCKALKHSVLKF